LRMRCSQGDIRSDEYQFAHRIFSGKYNFIEELHGTRISCFVNTACHAGRAKKVQRLS
jgi:hypothetical protein